ncbi:conserved unknown protein [Ectocarpus siliculosus]|uniref:Uncharacterized protein n=1 Tax=Ectocarpus siliculosus TaxID=2880 RepID=D8LID4_ECTSI|nr:conserved unknown protein [Ectocarpus siliculosus]|eukprot:CBN79973.1 conserved unknown protein [Ectocarpus siliculosus]
MIRYLHHSCTSDASSLTAPNPRSVVLHTALFLAENKGLEICFGEAAAVRRPETPQTFRVSIPLGGGIRRERESMSRFVVTGANKGIGLEIVKGLLETNKNAFVFLGSRDAARGQNAVQSLLEQNSESYSGRVEALEIDVSDASSVLQASETVRTRLQSGGCGGSDGAGVSSPAYLDALINNAGMIPEDASSPTGFASCIDVNFRGVVRTTEAFLPLLEPSKGRVAITSSSSGPSFVAKCSPERQALMTDPDVTHAQITRLVDECLAIASADGGLEEKFAAVGLSGMDGKMGVYGLSKALVNMYTVQLAREHPALIVNACTPGFIKTDMTAPFEKTMGKSLDEMGAKTPAEGAKVLVHLATGEVPSSGWYFGSDLQRSPLDRYRSPGDPAYDGK